MPELPEVETVLIGLNESTLGWQIEGGDVLLPRAIAYPDSPQAFLDALTGAEFIEWKRRGKYLIAKLSQGNQLGVHLRMTGSLLWCDRDTTLGKHTRVRLFLKEKGKKEKISGQKELRFDDQRTFGKVWWVPPDHATESIITGLQKLGLEPFDQEFTPEHLATKLRRSSRPIKTVLLDQETVAGIGNIYADESLFLGKIHPQKAANSLSSEQVKALHQGIIRSLSDGIAKGGTTFSSFQNVAGLKGNYIDTAWVFRRTGQPCNVCGTVISRIKLGGRATHFCAQCQSL
ncbi:MAG: DNA-formamidopyrimidine glycosylase [Pseudanabaena sp.]|jgi:formamidopyrimidine-DNA glycosylase|uniref:DNA-formamidopyrimidine glycosylase n=1 Tax=Pseudanabaena mucicola TaxID=71190 RepID=UPI002576322D|nr:DNA-formamidopyrimidine glycosylase [Pseudanabaena mucicola]MCA6509851.1 DNA-formamidopyrimidine glycosylase [Pseudanabaena sp. M109S1SP2A07QC]MCA6572074.1 DNA-formamidopyrimidine glycosylase [Pseudanabaena sp. M53BS1SP1A06MG]MCA6584566.1 DNA-formamidopyrimidine glycosylase [Pseudanabaena sp. M34BS1SP1A06MG]MCA6585896.1 DNA-formamidopyrimidine glycosylase [Pseudanabaena sp. M051S1SP1A06QC]MCA6592079.1 DNA-formamidopyrimidine glycosylase [Pseudanabaena sp. M38BS1SP1A06MG]MCA6595299.1 DNA-fo